MSEQWIQNPLEFQIHKHRDATNKFWEQMWIADQKRLLDALQVYWLCAKLGFPLNDMVESQAVDRWRGVADSQADLFQYLEKTCSDAWLDDSAVATEIEGLTAVNRHLGVAPTEADLHEYSSWP